MILNFQIFNFTIVVNRSAGLQPGAIPEGPGRPSGRKPRKRKLPGNFGLCATPWTCQTRVKFSRKVPGSIPEGKSAPSCQWPSWKGLSGAKAFMNSKDHRYQVLRFQACYYFCGLLVVTSNSLALSTFRKKGKVKNSKKKKRKKTWW